MRENEARDPFVPALGFHRLTALYDPLIRNWGAATRMRRSLVDALALKPGMRILELGAGPGRLAIQIKTEHPAVEAHALEFDPSMISRAKRNASAADVAITFRHANMTQLADERAFDRIYSTMTFHHLSPTAKLAALRAARRALKPGGAFVVVDFGVPLDLLQSALFRFVQQPLDGFANTRPHRTGGYERAIRETFVEVHSAKSWRTVAGTTEMFICRN